MILKVQLLYYSTHSLFSKWGRTLTHSRALVLLLEKAKEKTKHKRLHFFHAQSLLFLEARYVPSN